MHIGVRTVLFESDNVLCFFTDEHSVAAATMLRRPGPAKGRVELVTHRTTTIEISRSTSVTLPLRLSLICGVIALPQQMDLILHKGPKLLRP